MGLLQLPLVKTLSKSSNSFTRLSIQQWNRLVPSTGSGYTGYSFGIKVTGYKCVCFDITLPYMENFRQFWSYSTVVFSQNLPEAT